MDSTRPSSFSHLLYDRGVRFAAGLAVMVAIPVAVLFYSAGPLAIPNRKATARRASCFGGEAVRRSLEDPESCLGRPTAVNIFGCAAR
jgi:hypothetical protein